jgi:hypothetical protein
VGIGHQLQTRDDVALIRMRESSCPDGTSLSRIQCEIHINILIGVVRSITDVYDVFGVDSTLLLTYTTEVLGRFRKVSLEIPRMALPIGPILIGAYLSLSPEKGIYIYIYILCAWSTHIISTIEPLYVISIKYSYHSLMMDPM